MVHHLTMGERRVAVPLAVQLNGFSGSILLARKGAPVVAKGFGMAVPAGIDHEAVHVDGDHAAPARGELSVQDCALHIKLRRESISSPFEELPESTVMRVAVMPLVNIVPSAVGSCARLPEMRTVCAARAALRLRS